MGGGKARGPLHRDGGIPGVVGPGRWPIEFEGDEWIMQRKSVKKYGDDFMRKVNQMEFKPGDTYTFNNGGYVRGNGRRVNRRNTNNSTNVNRGVNRGTLNSTGAQSNLRFTKQNQKINRQSLLNATNTGRGASHAGTNYNSRGISRDTSTPGYVNKESKQFYDCVHPDCYLVCNNTMDCRDSESNMQCINSKCVAI